MWEEFTMINKCLSKFLEVGIFRNSSNSKIKPKIPDLLCFQGCRFSTDFLSKNKWRSLIVLENWRRFFEDLLLLLFIDKKVCHAIAHLMKGGVRRGVSMAYRKCAVRFFCHILEFRESYSVSFYPEAVAPKRPKSPHRTRSSGLSEN